MSPQPHQPAHTASRVPSPATLQPPQPVRNPGLSLLPEFYFLIHMQVSEAAGERRKMPPNWCTCLARACLACGNKARRSQWQHRDGLGRAGRLDDNWRALSRRLEDITRGKLTGSGEDKRQAK
ncbi:hypothetical protein E2C01_053455 [Portunus trituberculatus]|uniref:Uncharacterized protein n=1 Tax=Portunus trituberculatus TaxID=210409 RepID=A0A5B7GPH8_PORTR|nr:hypothetical protein [Portunus trituberculatus]